MISVKRPLFCIGKLVATPGALEVFEKARQSLWECLAKHLTGDWGCVCDEDRMANDESVKDGSRILSAYVLRSGVKVWIITEAEDDNGLRLATTILLPEEY